MLKILIADDHAIVRKGLKQILLEEYPSAIIGEVADTEGKNIIKHSRATGTQISLQTKADHVVLVMKDNGKGFDPQQTCQGIGLSNIHERAQFYNGIADIKSSAGAGCTLTVTIPVREN